MNDVLDYIGLANIYEKKEYTIEGKKKIYYEKIDFAFGFECTFNNSLNFVVLTGKIAGEVIDFDSVYEIASFKTLRKLCKENNYVYDYNKFISKYQKHIGDYYTFAPHEKLFSRITDQELLQKIRGKIKRL